MKYVIIAIILFLIESEYNYRVHLCDLEDLDNFEDKINFVLQKNSENLDCDFKKFKKSHIRWKHSNSRNLFPKYKMIQIKRQLFVHHCLRIFGEEKLIDLIEKNKAELVKKYGEKIDQDLEIFDILIKHFSIHEFKKYANKRFK